VDITALPWDAKPRVIQAPTEPIYRIGYAPDRLNEQVTFGGRFDHPSYKLEAPEQKQVPVVYYSTQVESAFGEALAILQPSRDLLSQLKAIAVDEPLPSWMEDIQAGIIPVEWYRGRQVIATTLDPSLRFVDLEAPETIHFLRLVPTIGKAAASLGFHDLDHAILTSKNRKLTQKIALFVYAQRDPAGQPLFAGLRYSSRLHPSWECWALFQDRVVQLSSSIDKIDSANPYLQRAAEFLGLEVGSAQERVILTIGRSQGFDLRGRLEIPLFTKQARVGIATSEASAREEQRKANIADEDIFATLVDHDLTVKLSPKRESKTRLHFKGTERGLPRIVLTEGLEELE
jgi:hypothetical protein